jgi:SOS-response transcriptional repressor LexA
MLLINRNMTARRREMSFEECVEKDMTPAQREVFLCIDEWWKKYGFGPTIDEVMLVTGDKGRGNVARKMKALMDLGICKGIPRRARTIRPAYLRVRDIV